MTNLTRIPQRLNGYEIISTLICTLPDGRPSDSQAVILGHDLTRRSSKFMTAYISVADNGPPNREWYWGHYFENYNDAMASLILRANAVTAGV